MTAARTRDDRASMGRLVGASLAMVALVLGMLSLSPVAAASTPLSSGGQHTGALVESGIVATADLTKFQAGNIIGDAVFFNKSRMTEAQIQSFLQAKVPTCRSGYTCLKDWYDTSRTTSADAMCAAYSGGVRERASRIIYKVAQACGINPQVLIVMLQKEQGLVTHTWPSTSRFTIAMGQGCPDTSACDTRYYGFFNQVYGAAWQMKRYANPAGTSRYFTWYPVGTTSSVRYHPNSACGSGPVLIRNQATANLYYYTPYQPNAAALRAGYGEGDACSAYGNRNFYNYFTDWFGSTQTVGSGLIKSGDPVYLVSGSSRYHVTREDYPDFLAAFGTPLAVDQGYVDLFSDAGQASRYLRNDSTGQVAYLDGGAKHWFATCTQVAAWGSACGKEMRITAELYSRLRVGPDMTLFARTVSGGRLHMISGSALVPMYDERTAASLNNGSIPYAAVMTAAQVQARTIALVRFEAGQFLTIEGSPKVWLPTDDGRLIYLSSWAHSAELGLPPSAARLSVPPAAVQGYDQSAVLGLFVSCGSTTSFASGGTLRPATVAAAAGFDVVPLDRSTCGKLRMATDAPLDRVYVRAANQSAVFLAVSGSYRHVSSRAVLDQLTGGVWPTVLSISSATLATLPQGAPFTSDDVWKLLGRPSGSVVQAQGQKPVYLVDAGTGWWVPSWSVGDELGLRSRLEIIPASVAASLRIQTGKLRAVVTCDGQAWVASAGVLHAVSTEGLRGLKSTPLGTDACASLDRSGSPITGRLFVVVGADTYVADAGTLRKLAPGETATGLNGGQPPTPVTWQLGTLTAALTG